MQHGWLADDAWFTQTRRQSRKPYLRDPETLRVTAAAFRRYHITDLFPHLCPCDLQGHLAPPDDAQVERFLDAFDPATFRVLPWIGGAHDVQAFPEEPAWRKTFCQSAADLLARHQRLAGVHLNIEPVPTGNPHFLILLDELRAALPKGKLISVAAYPTSTILHRFPEVHWQEPYFRQVAARADQLAVMMYDTGLHNPKLYRHLLAAWTQEVLAWSAPTPVLLGLPAYEDANTGYHDPQTENLAHALPALPAIHAGLPSSPTLPPNYQGVALYSDWEMTAAKWDVFQREFLRPPALPRTPPNATMPATRR